MPLKDPKDWKIAGKRVARLDTADKTTGALIYGIDLKLPGMLNAAIKDCPVFGGKVKSVDDKAALATPGVKKVVRVGDSARRRRGRHLVARQERRSTRCRSNGTTVPTRRRRARRSPQVLKAGLDAKEAVGRQRDRRCGRGAGRRAEQDRGGLFVPAPEPRDDGADERDRALDAGALRSLDARRRTARPRSPRRPRRRACRSTKCDVYKMLLGGGFGRRGAVHDWVRQVVLIAKEMPGTPVKLIWSREEDMTHGRYHPVTQCKLTAGLDAQGNITALHMRISGQSIVAGIFPQNIKDGKDPVGVPGPQSVGAGRRRSATRSRTC